MYLVYLVFSHLQEDFIFSKYTCSVTQLCPTLCDPMDWLDLLAVQGTLKSLLQQHSSRASILRRLTFFIVQLSHPYMTTGIPFKNSEIKYNKEYKNQVIIRGINQELGFGINRYTQLYMKQINNKNLLYSTENYIQDLIITYNEKELKTICITEYLGCCTPKIL